MNFGVIPETFLERFALWRRMVPVPLLDLLFGPLKARIIMAGVRLGLFESLRDESRTAAELADALRLDRVAIESAFAIPAAYGDLVAAILAGVATLALAARASWAIPVVWVFNVWGAIDLLHAIYQGQIGVGIAPGSLGAAFFIPTVVVPPLLVTHGLIFWLLLRPKQ